MSDVMGLRDYDPIFIGNDVRLSAGRVSMSGDILIPGGDSALFDLAFTNGLTARGGETPTTATRASNAYRTDWDGSKHTLTLVGTNVIRVGSYNDGTVTRNAVQIEGAATNLLTYSEDFSNAAWTDLDAGDSLGTGIATPDLSKTSAALVVDSTDGAHGFTQAATTTEAVHALSVFAKAGAEDFLYLSNDTVANAWAYFDLASGTVTSDGSAGTGYIENLGNGWYRCILTFTATAAANTMRIAAATADGDNTFAGDGAAISLHLWGAQLETGAYATSYIVTTSASATRAEDVLEYENVFSISPPYTVVAEALTLFNDASVRSIVDLDSGVGTAALTYLANTGRPSLFAQNSSTTQANIVDGDITVAGVWNTHRSICAVNDMRVYVNGDEEGTRDTSGTPPDVTTLNVGHNRSTSQRMIYGFIGRIRILEGVVPP